MRYVMGLEGGKRRVNIMTYVKREWGKGSFYKKEKIGSSPYNRLFSDTRYPRYRYWDTIEPR